MRKVVLTFVAMSFITITSCKNQDKKESDTLVEESEKLEKTEEVKEKKDALQITEKEIIEENSDNEIIEDIKITNKNENNSFLITNSSVEGIKIGDTFMEHSDKFQRANKEDAEGTFKGYNIMDKNAKVIAFAFADGNNKSKIGLIEITSTKYKTAEGIGIGSTFEEIKKAYPNSETHGSEIESRASVKAGNYYFLLDGVAFNTYNVDESKINPSTKIKTITIR